VWFSELQNQTNESKLCESLINLIWRITVSLQICWNFTTPNGRNAISELIFAGESKGIGILEVGVRRRKWEKENGAWELGEENKRKKGKKWCAGWFVWERNEKKMRKMNSSNVFD